MITGDGKAICDREIKSRKKAMYVGCNRPAKYQIGSRVSVGMTLHYCSNHAPVDSVKIWNATDSAKERMHPEGLGIPSLNKAKKPDPIGSSKPEAAASDDGHRAGVAQAGGKCHG